jgi:GYF domain 2
LESNRLISSLAATLPIVTIHVCHNDGETVGEFSEPVFRDKISSGELRSEDFYWHEGMADWKPIKEYRAIAKTQKIATAPPPSRPYEAAAIKMAQPVAARAVKSRKITSATVIWIAGIIIAAMGGLSKSMLLGAVGVLLLVVGLFMAMAGRRQS